MGQYDLRRRLGLEGQPSRDELVEDDTDRVEVAARVERIAASLLGAHVLGRAADDPRARYAWLLRLRAHLGQAEVDDLDEVAARPRGLQDDVLGLEVAVDDVLVVRLGERRERLAEHVDDAPERQRSVLVRDAREIAPAQEFHDQVELAVGCVAEVDDPHRVRVVQPARGARLGDEARGGVLFAYEVRVDDLHRDRAPEVRLFGAVDAPHPADADELENQVAARERAPDERIIGARGDLSDRESARRTEPMRVVARAGALGANPHGVCCAGRT